MDIKKKKAEIEKKFDELNKEQNTLVENGKQIQSKLAQINEEKIRLQGQFQLVEEMSKENVEKKEKK